MIRKALYFHRLGHSNLFFSFPSFGQQKTYPRKKKLTREKKKTPEAETNFFFFFFFYLLRRPKSYPSSDGKTKKQVGMPLVYRVWDDSIERKSIFFAVLLELTFWMACQPTTNSLPDRCVTPSPPDHSAAAAWLKCSVIPGHIQGV